MSFKVDAVLPSGFEAARKAATHAESLGYDGCWSTETQSDPFGDLIGAVFDTSKAMLGTNLAIAFARSPFVTATSSWQLQKASKGRFICGLGTQVKGHIERRFGMTWESPGPKLREYVRALKAIWSAFAGDEKLDFRGRFYNLDVLTPFFDPGPIDHPAPPVLVAAVNEYNAETAGLVADGLLVHPLHTRQYLDSVLLPAVDRGLAQSGRTRKDISVICPVFVVLDEDQSSSDFVRSQVAFYGSTRTYARVFESHGWTQTPAKLHRLMASGDFAGMADEITDEMLGAIAIVGRSDDLVDRLRGRYEGIADRLYFYNLFTSPFGDNDGRTAELVRALQ